jgi:hypothetical protein
MWDALANRFQLTRQPSGPGSGGPRLSTAVLRRRDRPVVVWGGRYVSALELAQRIVRMKAAEAKRRRLAEAGVADPDFLGAVVEWASVRELCAAMHAQGMGGWPPGTQEPEGFLEWFKWDNRAFVEGRRRALYEGTW